MRRKVRSLIRFMKSRQPDEVSEFAEKCGTNPVYLYQIANGYRRASHGLARLLDENSAGAVPKHDARPDIWEPVTRVG